MKHELKMLIWEITDACNLSCRHCYKRMISSSTAEFIDEIDIMETVSEFKQCGLKEIVISGGEPLIKKEKVLEIIRVCNRLGIETIVTTNGTLMSPEMAKLLKTTGLSGVQISIDGIDAKRHDRIRGGGTFSKAVAAIEACVDAGILVSIMTVPTIENIDELEGLFEFACNKGAKCLGVERPIASSRDSIYYFDESNLNRLHDAIERLENNGMIRIHCNDPVYQLRKLRKSLCNDISVLEIGGVLDLGCSACRTACVVSSNGNVRACTFTDFVIGNLKESSLQDIWNSSKTMSVCNRTSLYGICSDCLYFPVCRGCFAQRIAFGENLEGSDEACYMKTVSF